MILDINELQTFIMVMSGFTHTLVAGVTLTQSQIRAMDSISLVLLRANLSNSGDRQMLLSIQGKITNEYSGGGVSSTIGTGSPISAMSATPPAAP